MRASLLLALTVGWIGAAQAGVLLDQNFATFNNGDLVGQQGWTQPAVASPNLTIANSVLVFANTGQDAGVAFTSANSGSLYLGFKMRVTSSQTGDYFAAFNTTASGTAYTGRLSIKKGATTSKFVLGLLMGNTGATTSYGTTELDTNTDYVVIFKYNFVSGVLNDTGLIYVNPSNSSTENLNTPYLNTVTWAGTSAENAALAAVSIRQGGSSAAAAGTISRMIVSNDWASVTSMVVSAPSITSSAATLVGATTATLNGNVTADGGATITERGFVYKTSTGVTINDNKTVVSGTTGAYTLELLSLTPGATYYFKAYARNSGYTTLSSTELSFTTGALAPPTIAEATVHPSRLMGTL